MFLEFLYYNLIRPLHKNQMILQNKKLNLTQGQKVEKELVKNIETPVEKPTKDALVKRVVFGVLVNKYTTPNKLYDNPWERFS